MRRGLFVTGTDTDVGKTVASAALLLRYGRETTIRYWKPIQTGIEQDDDTAEVRRLTVGTPHEILDEGVRLPRPVSPHLAAQLAGQPIAVEPLVRLFERYPETDRWVVEGAGGIHVPLNTQELMIDLIQALGLAVVVVARSTLGTINHTLLTLAGLRARSLPVAGVLMIGPANPDNRSAIEQYGQVPVVGEMPCFDQLSHEPLVEWVMSALDVRGELARNF